MHTSGIFGKVQGIIRTSLIQGYQLRKFNIYTNINDLYRIILKLPKVQWHVPPMLHISVAVGVQDSKVRCISLSD